MSIIPKPVRALLGRIAPVVSAITYLGVMSTILVNPMLLDWRANIRYSLNPEPWEDRLTVVALDEVFAGKYDSPDITPRDYLAELVERISAYDPAVITLDYKFIEADEQEEGYDAFVRAVGNAKRVVLTSVFDTYTISYKQPTDTLSALAAGTGYAELFVGERDNTVRIARLFAEMNDGLVVPSLAATSLRQWYTAMGQPLPEVLNSTSPPLNPFEIRYSGHLTQSNFNYIGSQDVMEPQPDTPVLRRLLQDKLVLVGSTYTARDNSDQFLTPLGMMQGAEIHANILHQFFRQTTFWPTHVSGLGHLIGALIALCIAIFWLNRFRGWRLFRRTLFLLVGYLVLNNILYVFPGILLPLRWPLMITAYAALFVPLISDALLSRKKPFTDLKALLVISDLSETAREKLSLPPKDLVYESRVITYLNNATTDNGHLEMMKIADPSEIKRHLSTPTDLLHLIAPITHEGQLVLQKNRGGPAPIPVSQFPEVINVDTNLKTLILDTTSTSQTDNVLVSVARQLGEAAKSGGVPHVVVLSPKVSSDEAAVFVQQFYGLIARGVDVKEALRRAPIPHPV